MCTDGLGFANVPILRPTLGREQDWSIRSVSRLVPSLEMSVVVMKDSSSFTGPLRVLLVLIGFFLPPAHTLVFQEVLRHHHLQSLLPLSLPLVRLQNNPNSITDSE